MRSLVFSFALVSSVIGHAQIWALLNPAYKYNYSNDGSDTISNRIFVTHIDTLGVDSFRYELNRVGVWCDTCPGTQQGGGWLVNQAQFLGLSATVTPNAWMLEWSDHQLMIRTTAAIDESWSYDPGQSLMATVTSLDEGQVLGVPDSIKVISLSDGGTISISKEHGLIEMPVSNGGIVRTIGIQELGLGALIPAPEAFFALTPGDVVQYHTEGLSDNNAYSQSSEFDIKYTITDRYEDADTLVLTYSAIKAGDTHSWFSGSGAEDAHVNTVLGGEFRVPSIAYGALGLIGSYPGEVIWFAPEFYMYPAILFCVAEHGIDEYGRYVVRAKEGNSYVVFGSPNSGSGDGPYGGTYYTYASGQAAEYRTGPGLQKLGYYQSSSGSESNHRSYRELTGSVIAGDTIGTVSSDEFLGIRANDPKPAFRIAPNLVNDRIMLYMDPGSSRGFMIMDTEGRSLRSGTLTSAPRQMIDVSSLPEGLYILTLSGTNGRATQRFIIAR